MTQFTPNTEGVFYDLPETVYRAAPGISYSELKQFDEEATPAHFVDARKKKRTVTPDMEFGTILHTAVLQPELLSEAYVIEPATYPAKGKGDAVETKPWTYQANYCKEWRDKQNGKPILDEEKAATIAPIVAAVMNQPQFRDILINGKKEVSFFKRDFESGLMLKCRVDVIAVDGNNFTWLGDLKKVQRGEARQDRFAVTMIDRYYDVQAASYMDIAGASNFVFCAIEDSSPYECQTHLVTNEMRGVGYKRWRDILSKYAACVTQAQWPGYSRKLNPIYPPAWAVKKYLEAAA